jgi:glycosyltransferase involved in cell wall biosynthesis
MKIFIGLGEIAGYYKNLSQAFQELGIDCKFIEETQHPFDYRDRKNQNILEFLLVSINNVNKNISTNNFLKKQIISKIAMLIKIFIFIWTICNYDVFIFGFKSSFIKFHELPILRLFKKKIIYVFHGSDIRPPYIDGALFSEPVNNISVLKCIEITKQQKKCIQNIEKYANIVISHPLMGHFHERQFVQWLVIGIPYIYVNRNNTIERKKDSSNCANIHVSIVHSPSNPEAKGTFFIREAIKNLQLKGYYIDYIEITNKPNHIVLENLQNCDFVVDQIYSDTPLAGFATEAAFYGKPAIVGGYFTEQDLSLEAKNVPPSHHCHPEEIEQAIEKLIVDRDYRLELGQKAKTFVETQWNYKKVAERYLKLIEDDIPQHWLYNPQNINYLYGCCLTQSKIKNILKSMIEKRGKESLQLQDKPKLEQMFIEFAYSDNS